MKKMRMMTMVLACGCLLCGAVAWSAEGPGEAASGKPGGQFESYDKDGDGALSLEEFKAIHAKREEMMKERMSKRGADAPPIQIPSAEEVFKRLDADGGGTLTQDEIGGGGRAQRAPVMQPGQEKVAGERVAGSTPESATAEGSKTKP